MFELDDSNHVVDLFVYLHIYFEMMLLFEVEMYFTPIFKISDVYYSGNIDRRNVEVL